MPASGPERVKKNEKDRNIPYQHNRPQTVSAGCFNSLNSRVWGPTPQLKTPSSSPSVGDIDTTPLVPENDGRHVPGRSRCRKRRPRHGGGICKRSSSQSRSASRNRVARDGIGRRQPAWGMVGCRKCDGPEGAVSEAIWMLLTASCNS